MEQNLQMEKEFLNNVSKALRRKETLAKASNRKNDEVGPPAFWKEQEKFKDKSLDLFKTNLEALTGRVAFVKNKEDVQAKLREWISELDAGSIICWDHPQLKEIANTDSLAINIAYWNNQKSEDELRKIAAKADIGLTWAEYGIAYTGTIALFSGPRQGRSVSLLPPTHIAVLRKEQIVPTMSTVVKKLKEIKGVEKMPSSINFITGPSRSADIEMDLSIGVHGPYRVWVIVMD